MTWLPVGVMVSYLRFLMNSKNIQTNNLILENILSFHQFNRPPVSSWTVNCFDAYAKTIYIFFNLTILGIKPRSHSPLLTQAIHRNCPRSDTSRPMRYVNILTCRCGWLYFLKMSSCMYGEPSVMSMIAWLHWDPWPLLLT